MANYGKFIDRAPVICAAGKPSGDPHGDNVATTFNWYTVEDAITSIKHDANIWKDDVFVPPLKLPPIRIPAFQRTEIKDIINPSTQTRYTTLLEDLKETTYESYWNKEIGKGRDQVPGLPAGIRRTEVTYGDPSISDIPLKEIVNPSKTYYQVLVESQVGHEMYKKTHNDYNVGEKIARGYSTPPYIPTKRFGKRTIYDPRGIWVRCCCKWHIQEPVIHANKIQADYFHRIKPPLGRVLAPNRNIECVPKGHGFGDRSIRSFYGVEDLIKDKDCPPCVFKRDFYKWLGTLNKFKGLMKKRYIHGFSFIDFYKRALYLDENKIGFLPLPLFYKLCQCPDIRVSFPREDIEPLLKFLNILNGDMIDYRRFINLIDLNAELPELTPFNDVPKDIWQLVTTTQAAGCDYLIIDNSSMLAAGVPSVRTDLELPMIPSGQCKADLESLGEYTTVNALLHPSVYSLYGLNYRDFFAPRSAETIKKLFENIGYSFPETTFEKLWKEGQEIDKTGLVCVDTFKALLNKYFPIPKLSVDELQCDDQTVVTAIETKYKLEYVIETENILG